MSYTPSLETQLADLRESWRNLVRQRDEQSERIEVLLAEVERLQGEVRRLREENALLKQHKDCLMSWGDQEWEALDGAARAHWLRIADWYAKQRAALGSKEGDG